MPILPCAKPTNWPCHALPAYQHMTKRELLAALAESDNDDNFLVEG